MSAHDSPIARRTEDQRIIGVEIIQGIVIQGIVIQGVIQGIVIQGSLDQLWPPTAVKPTGSTRSTN